MEQTSRLRVAYLVGTSYCGSTLMALLVDSHPQIASIGEIFLKPNQRMTEAKPPCTCGEILQNCTFWHQIFQSVNEKGFDFSVSNWTIDYMYKNPLLKKLLSQHSSHKSVQALQQVASILPIHRKRIRQIHGVNVAFIQSVLNLTGAVVFVDTSKQLVRLCHLLDIPELDIHVIRMVRDVRAFASSCKRQGRPIAEAAKHWKTFQLAVNDFTRSISSHKIFPLRYEDVCQDYGDWMKSLYSFLGVEVLDPPDTIVTQEHHVLGNRRTRAQDILMVQVNDSWREVLTEEEVTLTLRIAGDVNEGFGYK